MFESLTKSTHRVRVMRNRHGSASVACDKWMAGTLWGNRIQLGPSKFHVYGAWKRRWVPVSVEFQDRQITVVRTKAREGK